MVIQILVTLGVIFLVFPNLYLSYKKKSLTSIAFIIWLVCWVAGLILIWFPNLINLIGTKLGVGRSIDALVYISIVYLLYSSLILKLKMNDITKEITLLNRKLALKDISYKKGKNN